MRIARIADGATHTPRGSMVPCELRAVEQRPVQVFERLRLGPAGAVGEALLEMFSLFRPGPPRQRRQVGDLDCLGVAGCQLGNARRPVVGGLLGSVGSRSSRGVPRTVPMSSTGSMSGRPNRSAHMRLTVARAK